MVPTSSKNEYEIAVSMLLYQNDRKELSATLESFRISKRLLLITMVDNSPVREYIFVGENIGFGAGHNLTIRRSLELAPYHAVVNPDVIVSEDTFDRLIALMGLTQRWASPCPPSTTQTDRTTPREAVAHARGSIHKVLSGAGWQTTCKRARESL